MSTFTTEQLKKKWADYEDSESDREEEKNFVPANAAQKKRGKEIVAEKTKAQEEQVESDEEEEEEEEEDDDELDLSRIKVSSAPPQVKVEQKPRNLSKKEQLAMKKKELEDLDILLAQYNDSTSAVETSENAEAVEEKPSDKQEDINDESKAKKKKKKKVVSKMTTQPESNISQPVAEASIPSAPEEVSAILKSKLAKKAPSSTKKSTSDPLKIAMEEALKSSSSKKKKRDKSKFSEGSY